VRQCFEEFKWKQDASDGYDPFAPSIQETVVSKAHELIDQAVESEIAYARDCLSHGIPGLNTGLIQPTNAVNGQRLKAGSMSTTSRPRRLRP